MLSNEYSNSYSNYIQNVAVHYASGSINQNRSSDNCQHYDSLTPIMPQVDDPCNSDMQKDFSEEYNNQDQVLGSEGRLLQEHEIGQGHGARVPGLLPLNHLSHSDNEQDDSQQPNLPNVSSASPFLDFSLLNANNTSGSLRLSRNWKMDFGTLGLDDEDLGIEEIENVIMSLANMKNNRPKEKHEYPYYDQEPDYMPSQLESLDALDNDTHCFETLENLDFNPEAMDQFPPGLYIRDLVVKTNRPRQMALQRDYLAQLDHYYSLEQINPRSKKQQDSISNCVKKMARLEKDMDKLIKASVRYSDASGGVDLLTQKVRSVPATQAMQPAIPNSFLLPDSVYPDFTRDFCAIVDTPTDRALDRSRKLLGPHLSQDPVLSIFDLKGKGKQRKLQLEYAKLTLLLHNTNTATQEACFVSQKLEAVSKSFFLLRRVVAKYHDNKHKRKHRSGSKDYGDSDDLEDVTELPFSRNPTRRLKKSDDTSSQQ